MSKQFLSEPSLLDCDLDSGERLQVHRQILAEKVILRGVFQEFHHEIMKLDRHFFGNTQGQRIEIGAGVYPVRESYPDVFASDIVVESHLDCILDAQSLGLADNSIRAIYGQNCYHHFPEPGLFFKEAIRVTKPGGGVIIIEPYYGAFATFLFKRMFASESFDKNALDWNLVMDGPMVGANQALSYIVFNRDAHIFAERFPELELVHSAPFNNYLRYLLSGGLNFKQLVPNFSIDILKGMEYLLQPLEGLLALHHLIVLRSRKS